MSKDVIIIGAGLCGLHTAYLLQKQGLDVTVLEGRQRIGGRILTQYLPATDNTSTSVPLELGPSWFWPHQKRMQTLCQELNLSHHIFEQAHAGKKLKESKSGEISLADDDISMANSLRLDCGMQRIVSALYQKLSANTVLTGHKVTHIKHSQNGIEVTTDNNGQEYRFDGQSAVICAPPNVIVNTTNFSPPLPPQRIEELASISAWMATQAKVLVTFEQPFWQLNGFSGDAVSELGPVMEWHDSSLSQNGPYVLLGFLGIPGVKRERTADLEKQVLTQIERLFGIPTKNALDIIIQDWAFEPFTAVESDKLKILETPSPNIPNGIEPNWNNKLIWSGSESSTVMKRNNGYLEGALEASFTAYRQLTDTF
ncbi:FAD-dependent oxidoreductase [Alteromonadaceae bacterium M269]|nr:FAD-dependent oxidoreductase [Alteromonadaceae bacterium M269]